LEKKLTEIFKKCQEFLAEILAGGKLTYFERSEEGILEWALHNAAEVGTKPVEMYIK
jgi:hypothetical protein